MSSDYQIGVRVPQNLKDDMDREMKLSNRDNISEFVKDAIKFYIRDLEDRRFKEPELEKNSVNNFEKETKKQTS